MTVTYELYSAAENGKVDDVVRYLEEGRCHIDAKDGVNIHMLLLEAMFFSKTIKTIIIVICMIILIIIIIIQLQS